MGDLILTDFKTRTWHKHKSLEQLAQDIASQIGGMIGEEVACEMVPYGGAGIDGMKFEPEDCA